MSRPFTIQECRLFNCRVEIGLIVCQLPNRELSDPLPARFREISEQRSRAAATEEATHAADALIHDEENENLKLMENN